MLEEYTRHFTEDITKEIDDFTTESVFIKSRYIFTTRDHGEESGYCTHCKKDFETHDKLKHNSKYICPECGSECIVKQGWRGHKTLIDRACFVYYEKSIADPQVMIAKGYYVERYYGDYRKVQNGYSLEAVYIFGADKEAKC